MLPINSCSISSIVPYYNPTNHTIMAKHTDAKPEKADEKEKADEEEKANEKEEKEEKEAEHSEEYYQQWLEHIPPIDFAVVDDSDSDSESVSNVEEEDVKGGEQMLEGLVEESKITEGAQ